MAKSLLRTAITAVSLTLVCSCSCNEAYDPDKQQVFIGEDIAVAQTEYGKVRGFILRGIYNFRGIPYGASTEGKNRFMPPQPPQSWDGVRPAVAFGASAPQTMYDQRPESYSMFVDHWNYDLIDEDCLRLNVWTPALDSAKRPVIVWLHGGGFSKGNGIEQDGYNGENIARSADAVFVSINHRLNVFGFSDLSLFGEKYRDSGNVGMLDIVEALKWVNRNIANFGGDPNNVTIMGQSGGGSKVCILSSMPAAKGLVHKGVALSGNAVEGSSQELSRRLGAAIVEEAGLSADEVDKLQEMPWREYMEIAERAATKLGLGVGSRGMGFRPVADGINIPYGKFHAADNAEIPDIPMLFCSTFYEWNPNRDEPELENISFEEVVEKLAERYGEKASSIVDAYRQDFPQKRPIEIWALILSNRLPLVESAAGKLQQKSPVYVAWFGWESPLFDGRHRAFHCIDISFWLGNTDLMITHCGGGKSPRKLSQKMVASLSKFIRTGNPNCSRLPSWPQYDDQQRNIMILDNKCEIRSNPDGRGLESLK